MILFEHCTEPALVLPVDDHVAERLEAEEPQSRHRCDGLIDRIVGPGNPSVPELDVALRRLCGKNGSSGSERRSKRRVVSKSAAGHHSNHEKPPELRSPTGPGIFR